MVKKHSKKRLIIGALVAALAVTAWLLTRKGGTSGEQVPVFAVQRGPLTIAVTSGGSIQSRDKVVISSELEGNNTVIWVITEGVNVQPGDLLFVTASQNGLSGAIDDATARAGQVSYDHVGLVAGPIFAKIGEKAASYLHLQPSIPEPSGALTTAVDASRNRTR